MKNAAPWVSIFVALTVTFVWAAVSLVSVFSRQPIDPSFHIVMGIVATGLFGVGFFQRNKNGASSGR